MKKVSVRSLVLTAGLISIAVVIDVIIQQFQYSI